MVYHVAKEISKEPKLFSEIKKGTDIMDCCNKEMKMGGGRRCGDSLPGMLLRCGRYVARCGSGHVGQGGILKLLAEKGETTQGELREMLGIQPGSLSELLGRLEERGFVERVRDEDDRRKGMVKLTDAGRSHIESCRGGCGKKDVFSALTEQEKAELARILKKLEDSWAEMSPGRCRGRGMRGHGGGCHGGGHDCKAE